MRDNYPISPYHMLVIPRRHVKSFFDLEQEEVACMMSLLFDIQRILRPEGCNVGINAGEVAGQTIDHVHMHFIPRTAGDVTDPRGGVRWVIPENADYWSEQNA